MKMKKLSSIILAASLFAFSGIFQSCEEETNPAPVITFDQGAEVQLSPGVTSTTLTGEVTAEAGLKTVTFHKIQGLDEILLTTINDFDQGVFTTTDDVTYNFRYDVTGITEDATIKLTAIDKDDQEVAKSIVIKAGGSAAGPIDTWTATLGSYNSATGSSFATSNGQVYTSAGAAANSGLIDFLYFYGSSNGATLAAPDDTDAATVFTALSNWATRNDTRFQMTTLTVAAFDDVDDDAVITEEADGAANSKANQLSEGDVVAFVTAENKMGLVKIGTISGTAAGTMNITVKVQK